MLDQTSTPEATPPGAVDETSVVVRFAGDSGDGIQTMGSEFAQSTALAGHDLVTFPDYPAEIRAPAGTTFGVSAFQIRFGVSDVHTHGDSVDVLVAFNPAALAVNLKALKPGGRLLVDAASFGKRNLEKAGYARSPLDDDSLAAFRVERLDMTAQVHAALADLDVGKKAADSARNFWALGLVYWMYGRDRQPTLDWISGKFAKRPEIAAANAAALNAGHAFGETVELGAEHALTTDARATVPAGTYRTVTGTDGCVLGLAAVAAVSGMRLHYCSYPITPASNMLHGLAKLGGRGVSTFQAEDEIAAAAAALGASYAGALGVTGTSGPGLALKSEVLGLACAAELPLLVIDVQRAGPSTGMPTKTEQADLLLALHGRHGEAPMPVFAPATPAECFGIVLQAARVAVEFMTPVAVLSDAFIANAAEPWRIPDVARLPDLRPTYRTSPEGFHPFARDPLTLARPWAPPGTPSLAHRLGGLERSASSGHISYDPANHQRMTELRAEKLDRVRNALPLSAIEAGAEDGDVLVIGWGSTYGALRTATEALAADGHRVGHLHLRHLNPLPREIADIAARFRSVVVAELNAGQLRSLIRDRFLIDAHGLNQVSGQPFTVARVAEALRSHLS